MEEYDVPIYGMKEGVYDFDFSMEDGFFEYFGNSDIIGGKIQVNLSVHRRSQFMEFHFNLKGSVRIICDRCLEEFNYQIETNEMLYLRYGDVFEEVSDNVIIIPREEPRVNIAQYLYEYTVLNLPVSRMHKEDDCNPEMLKKLGLHKASEEEKIDPRWDALKKLR